jgi:hypothetical protein
VEKLRARTQDIPGRAAQAKRGFGRIDAVGVRSTAAEEPAEGWSELTSTRYEPVNFTFSGLGSSRSTSAELT